MTDDLYTALDRFTVAANGIHDAAKRYRAVIEKIRDKDPLRARIAELEEERRVVRDSALEEAAMWHETKAKECFAAALKHADEKDAHNAYAMNSQCDHHELSAAGIRSLKSQPLTGKESGG